MIFSQYKETCEVLQDYPKIKIKYIKDYIIKSIRKLLHANIDVHRRRLNDEFPVEGVNVFQKFNHIVQT